MATVKAIPEGMHSLTPHIVCDGVAAAIEFYKKAFAAVEEVRLSAPNGQIMHARIRICGSALMMAEEAPQFNALGPKTLKGSPVTIHLYVEDVDAFVKRAADAGATVTMQPADMFWGDRYAVLEDPFGHRWSVATHLQDMTGEEMKQAMQKMFR